MTPPAALPEGVSRVLRLAVERRVLDPAQAAALAQGLARLAAGTGAVPEVTPAWLERLGVPPALRDRLLALRLALGEDTDAGSRRDGQGRPLPAGGETRAETRADATPQESIGSRAGPTGVGPGAASTAGGTLASALRRGPLQRTPLAGTTVGPWRVEAELARGGMGAVLRARRVDAPEAAPVALKVLLAGDQASDTQRKRLLREAAAARKLDDPGIVRVLDAGESDGLAWVAMELVEGESLAERLPRLTWRTAARLLVDVGRALGAAHARGIVHRDLKPANVLLRPDGSPVVADFGIAHDPAQSSALTRTGALLGTPTHMAPEQAAGAEPTPATDVWALGVLLYEALTGRLPFAEADVVAQMRAVTEGAPTRPRALRPGLPAAVEAVCLRALEKAPARRFADGAAFALELEAALAARAQAGRGRRAPGLAVALGLGAALAAVAGATAVVASRGPRDGERAGAPTGPGVGGPGPSGGGDPVGAGGPAGPTAVAPAPAVGPQRLVLRPGPLAGKDAYVRNEGLYANDNFGLVSTLLVGDRAEQGGGDYRALLEFDLGRLPPGAQVERATLRLRCTSRRDLRRDLRLVIRAIVARGPDDPRLPWREGTGTHDDVLDGVCWDGDLDGPFPAVASRRPDLSQPDADEATDRGSGPNGVVAAATLEPGPEPGPDEGWLALDVTALVRAWADGLPNHGLQVAHATEGPPHDEGRIAVASSDHPDPASRPALELDYVGPPPGEDDEEARLAAARREAEGALAGLERLAPAARRPALDAALAAAPFSGPLLLARARLLAGTRPGQAWLDAESAGGRLDPAPAAEVHGLLVALGPGLERWELTLAHLDRLGGPGHDPLLLLAHAAALAGAGRDPADVDRALAALPPAGPDPPWLGHGGWAASVHWVRGRALLARDDPAALDELEAACALASGAPRPLQSLVEALLRAGRLEDALARCEAGARETGDERLARLAALLRAERARQR